MNQAGGATMKVHISLNVSDIDKSVGFYKRMLDAEPAKYIRGETTGSSSSKSGYAKFDIANPPLNLTLNENAVTKGSRLSHLGLQVGSTDEVMNFKERWEASGLITAEEIGVICCYARQDKAWVSDPDGNEWEAFTVLENVETMAASETACCTGDKGPQGLIAENQTENAAVTTISREDSATVPSSSCC